MNKPKIGDKIGEIRYGLEFLCQKCNKIFETKDYCDNPYFLADTIANCPTCGGKCWEVMARDTPIRKFKELKAENTRLKEIIEDALLLIDSGDGYEIYRKKNDLPFLKDELYSNYLGRLRNHWSNRAAEAVKGDKL